MAGMGPVSMNTGSEPTTAMVWTRASGRNPWRRTASADATRIAAAPSLIWLARAAVSRPPSLIGVSAARASAVEPRRGPSS